ncbi:class II aldolase/adducin family protein [Acidiphilium acidophilum]|uniref:class II aldolase/adducin family protein n=1 Tax=Acidiphilium acidophilum TaxID=76588 RepID=UPI002E8E6A1A|nr:class II aldolase/adducin family protein [Acidiphilium acidophilum]
MNEPALRTALIHACRQMNALGINQGTSGNISLRSGTTMLISPSATPYDALEPDMIAAMPLDADDGRWTGPKKPSTEWRFHRDILRARPDIHAVVHSHPTFATTLAIARKPIEACHYMIAVFGGTDIRCAPYATFGTSELSAHALTALQDRMGCLLANHGMIALGETIDAAMWRAVELETLARQYYHALLLGNPHILTEAEIEATRAQFAGYGHHRSDPPTT